MNENTPLGELLQAVTEGLARPRHTWTAVVVAIALAAAWALARALTAQVERRIGAAPRAARGAHGFAPIPGSLPVLRSLLFPALAICLMRAGEGILRLRHVLVGPDDARLLHLAMWLLAAIAAMRLLFALLRSALGSSELTAVVERVIAAAAAAGVALYATGALEDVVAWLHATAIPIGTNARLSLWSMLVGTTTTGFALLAAMWLGALVERRLDSQTRLEPNLRIVLARIARALILVVALLVALALSGIDLTVLSVFGGALGVGLGLGLQRIASNYVSGFILLLDRSLRIGDIVTVDKYYGQVTQISTRYTVLRATDGTEAVLPNEMLVSSPVVNNTLGDRRMVLAATVAVDVDTDVPQACGLLAQAAAGVKRVLPDPPPATILREARVGNLLLEIDFWIGDPENGRGNVISDVLIAALACLRANGIRLAPSPIVSAP